MILRSTNEEISMHTAAPNPVSPRIFKLDRWFVQKVFETD
ncbi:hypothetical protein DFP97_10963 [Paenibacillus prosopidis]|uniref:Uncharacterized protein n=1 Tax=Paenibacillus prosopidis TaxID=630520 RepID=A0A368VW85_9BACL|nr:hypothetical protein DFP97_10963 [Paenibacillus prosopidis]